MSGSESVEDFFPPTFKQAVESSWGDEAHTRLKGVMASVAAGCEPSEIAAQRYLQSQHRVKPFLNENSIISLIYGSEGGVSGSVVDFVASTPGYDGLILVEAKPQLDSATLRKQPPQQKFGHTISQLRDFYRRNGQTAPAIKKLIITVRKVMISGNSRWSVSNDLLKFEGKDVFANGTTIPISVVEVV